MIDDKLPDFQPLLNSYKGDIKFIKLINRKDINEDETIYQIETDKGNYIILELDFVSDLSYVKNLIKDTIGKEIELQEVNKYLEKFSDYLPVKHTTFYKEPADFENLRKYMGYIGSSHEIYFNFLAKKIE